MIPTPIPIHLFISIVAISLLLDVAPDRATPGPAATRHATRRLSRPRRPRLAAPPGTRAEFSLPRRRLRRANVQFLAAWTHPPYLRATVATDRATRTASASPASSWCSPAALPLSVSFRSPR